MEGVEINKNALFHRLHHNRKAMPINLHQLRLGDRVKTHPTTFPYVDNWAEILKTPKWRECWLEGTVVEITKLPSKDAMQEVAVIKVKWDVDGEICVVQDHEIEFVENPVAADSVGRGLRRLPDKPRSDSEHSSPSMSPTPPARRRKLLPVPNMDAPKRPKVGFSLSYFPLSPSFTLATIASTARATPACSCFKQFRVQCNCNAASTNCAHCSRCSSTSWCGDYDITDNISSSDISSRASRSSNFTCHPYH